MPNDPILCPPVALELCDSLPILTSKKDADFKAWSKGNLGWYKACKIKQALLAECINAYNKTP